MPKNEIISQNYIDTLQQECHKLIELCAILNNSMVFQSKVQAEYPDDKLGYVVKAEYIVLQDIVNLYHRFEQADNKSNNAKSRFTLAYFYESLKKGELVKTAPTKDLNNLITGPAFEKDFKEIALSVSNNFNTPLITSLLKDINSDHTKRMNHHLYKLAHFIADSDGEVSKEEEILLTEIAGHSGVKIPYADELPNDTLEKSLEDLNGLIGLNEAKEQVKNIINFLKIQDAREKEKLPKVSNSLHSVFTGPPGTGKTSVARILSRIYKHLGVLEKGHLVETDRAGLVAGYVGQTAIRVDEIIKSALGGVLFIDEAYSLSTSNMSGNDYGKEVVEILLKRMEDYRDRFIVIVAGYPDEMRVFIESNPGLKSRFNQYLEFKHYNPQELLAIFKTFCTKYAFNLTSEAEEKVADIFAMADEKKTQSYGNAREARNIFEMTVRLQADRLVNITEINAVKLSEITEEDIPPVKKTVDNMTTYGMEEP